jgi:hypothetical protein
MGRHAEGTESHTLSRLHSDLSRQSPFSPFLKRIFPSKERGFRMLNTLKNRDGHIETSSFGGLCLMFSRNFLNNSINVIKLI